MDFRIFQKLDVRINQRFMLIFIVLLILLRATEFYVVYSVIYYIPVVYLNNQYSRVRSWANTGQQIQTGTPQTGIYDHSRFRLASCVIAARCAIGVIAHAGLSVYELLTHQESYREASVVHNLSV